MSPSIQRPDEFLSTNVPLRVLTDCQEFSLIAKFSLVAAWGYNLYSSQKLKFNSI